MAADDEEDDDEVIDFMALSDEEGQRQLEAWIERKGFPPKPRELPPDLTALYRLIGSHVASRRWGAGSPCMVEGFDARYAIIGGIGLVVEAHDPELERKVALKFWKQGGAKSQQALLREAKSLAKLSHRNVLTIYETRRCNLSYLLPPEQQHADAGERVFLVMEWIDGVDGHEWMKHPRAWPQVREVFMEAGLGLAAAHEAGIQHRDFKPDNMMIGNDGRVVVADFGLAESLREVGDADPRWGTPAGTPAYMAPERLCGEAGDSRSDQYSFCAAFWQGLFGVRPFPGNTADELLDAMEQSEPRTIAGVDVPPWLIDVLRKGLALEPDDRYPSMPELLAACGDSPKQAGDDAKSSDDEASAVVDPTNLLDGRAFVGWGPPLERRLVAQQSVTNLATCTGLAEEVITEGLDRDLYRYVLTKRLPSTPHATVYAGIDVALNLDVEVEIHQDLRLHATQRAIRDNQVVANVHPNIVRIYEIGEDGPWFHSIIERCDLDLHAWRSGQDWRAILQRLIEVGCGVGHVHVLGYPHGNITAKSVVIKNGTAKLGLAAVTRASEHDDAGHVAPEVHEHGPSEAGDVFALAVTTFAVLFDDKPFLAARSIAEGVQHVEDRKLRTPSKIPAGLPRSVLPLLVRAMDPDPNARPSLDEFVRGLQAAVDQWPRRLRWAKKVLAAIGTLVIGITIGALIQQLGTSRGIEVADAVVQAEKAVRDGEIDTAVDLVYKTYNRVDEFSNDQILVLAGGIEGIARDLEAAHYGDAIEVWAVTVRLYKRASAGALKKAEEARAAQELIQALSQSK